MTKKVWIDLTDISKWDGQHGGTQRVVYGIAEDYYLNADKYDVDLDFFVFNDSDKTFYKSYFEPIRQRVEAANSDSTLKTSRLTRQQKIKQYIIQYTPANLRSKLPGKRTILRVGKSSYYGLLRAKRLLDGVKIIHITKRGERVQFAAGEVVLILGKPWDTPYFIPAIARHRAEVDFILAAVIYDLVIPLYPHLHSPQLFKSYTQYTFEVAIAADLLLPISHSSERDLLEFCKELSIPRPNTEVIRLGDELSVPEHTEKPSEKINSSFLLCVGTMEIRKNHTLLFYVYKLARERGIDLPQLVIVGRPGWLAGDITHLFNNDDSLRDKILILSNVSDKGLAWLYSNCLFTVYPSMYEGWGLPVAESAQYGKLCIASSSSSIPEIAGEIMEYFSPYDPAECLSKIVEYLDPNKLSSKQKQVKSEYVPTTWHQTTVQVKNALDKLHG